MSAPNTYTPRLYVGSETQSALQEVKDQLFLDTADAGRLNIITANYGLQRPLVEFSDDHWRALARQIMLRPKQIRTIFDRILEICLGPQFSRVNNLKVSASIGDNVIEVQDSSVFVQLGTLILDEGLPTEETVQYSFRDIPTNKIVLNSNLLFNHAVVASASSYLTTDILIGAVSVPLIDTSVFPTAGFPYTILLDEGTDNEEAVRVTANTVATNTLTCVATTKDHVGPTVLFLQKPLDVDTFTGRTFIKLSVSDIKFFPNSGFIKINIGGITEETVQYTSIDIVNGVVYLKTPLVNNHLATERVDLVTSGAKVSTASVREPGVYWDFFETKNREIQVFVPPNIELLKMNHASWLHEDVPSPFSTTLAVGTVATDTSLVVNSNSGLPEAGLVQVNGAMGPIFFYILNNNKSFLSSSTSIGAVSILVDNINNFPTTGFPYNVEIGAGTVDVETVAVSAISGSSLVIAATTNSHQRGDSVAVTPPILYLTADVGSVFMAGTAVDLYTVSYVGTDLEDGNIRDGTGAFRFYHYNGPYAFVDEERAPSGFKSKLTASIPFSTRVAFTQTPGFTNLEVVDASSWPAPPFTPFDARIGFKSGFEETNTLTDRTLKIDVNTAGITINAGAGAGVSLLTLTSNVLLAGSDGVNPAGYRLLIDAGGANEETVVINQKVGLTQISLVNPTVNPHVIGESISLFNDILTFDSVLVKKHFGDAIGPSKNGQLVDPYTSELSVVSGLPFTSTGGIVLLNFGKEIINAKSRIVTIVNPLNYTLLSTTDFPTSGFPYPVILGEGTVNEETVYVTANNTMTNTLTFAMPGAQLTHQTGRYVVFTSGEPEAVEYSEVSVNTLVLDPPVPLNSGHLSLEYAIMSLSESSPRLDGFSFDFKLPRDPASCFKYAFELVRAAGIKITALNHK